MSAQRALLYNPLFFIVVAHTVGASHSAILAADALVLVDEDYPIFTLMGSPGGADFGALRVFAMLAQHGKEIHLQVWKFPVGSHYEHLAPEIPQSHIVLLLTGDGAGVASYAPVQI
jgi:hypothetical protein